MNPKDQLPLAGKPREERHCASCGEGFLGYPDQSICKVCVEAGFEGEVNPPVGEPVIEPITETPSPEPSEAKYDFDYSDEDVARARAVFGELQPHLENALNNAFMDGYRKGRDSRGADTREPSELSKRITAVINELRGVHRENNSDTPDFILGEGLEDVLAILEQVIERREVWYGRKSEPAK